MNIAKLTISYDRGVSLNKPDDLLVQDAEKKSIDAHVAERGYKTADGKVLRGLGSHFRSEADAELVKERDAAAREIYSAFRKSFLAAPIEGLYFVPERGQAKTFISKLEVRDDMRVSVSEFELTAPSDLEQAEMQAWGTRIKNQLASISLGRKKEADEDGLNALLALSKCPMLKKSTGDSIRSLVEAVRCQKINVVDVKRSLDKLVINVDTETLSPRRTPKLVGEVA